MTDQEWRESVEERFERVKYITEGLNELIHRVSVRIAALEEEAGRTR